MVLLDLRNHGRSAGLSGLNPPHDIPSAANDVANLVKSQGWSWPDVVLGHSMGGKVALQYAMSCARGDYGTSAKLPKQVFPYETFICHQFLKLVYDCTGPYGFWVFTIKSLWFYQLTITHGHKHMMQNSCGYWILFLG